MGKKKNNQTKPEKNTNKTAVDNTQEAAAATLETTLETLDAVANQLIGEINAVAAAHGISAELTEPLLEDLTETSLEAQALEESLQAAVDESELNLDGEIPMGPETVVSPSGDSPLPGNSLLVTDRQQIRQVLEAIIFAAPKAMSVVRLRNLLNHFNYDSSVMIDVLDEMITSTADNGFQLIKVAGGYQYRTHPEHAEVLQKLLEDKPARLSASALEVLAITAYRQPVSRGDIDSVRGVDSGHLMRGLLEKNLIRTLGHAETPGRPLLYGTTPYFLEVFSLGSLDDLPQMEELKRELVAGDSSLSPEEALLLSGEVGISLDGSGLAANPDRGTFDALAEEAVEHPDFGLDERAKEDVRKEIEGNA